MRPSSLQSLVIIVFCVLLMSACAPHQIYRGDYKEVCVSSNPVNECANKALQEYKDNKQPDAGYMLGFIEFDDQGQLWDREQMYGVVNKIGQEAMGDDALIVVFVHGWKHSAAPGDDNIDTFRGALKRIALLENRISRAAGDKPRKVVGVYLGWRGGSVDVWGLKELTFWDRKNTAHEVGYGGVAEVLSRLEQIKLTRDAIARQDEPDLKKRSEISSRTRLAVIGHSFGGAVVFSAVSKILETRFINSSDEGGVVSDAKGFGNLVVLINPAFEATRVTPLSDMSTERGFYSKSQLPVLVVLTSEADYATKYAFPIGRWFSTLFEQERDAVKRKNAVTAKVEEIDQGEADLKTIGHFDPYKTHYLKASKIVDRKTLEQPTVEADLENLFTVLSGWKEDEPGSKIKFDGSVLERTKTSAGRNPYLNIRVDEELIEDHNDIADPRIIGFIRQIILLASQGGEIQKEGITLEKVLQAK